MDNITSYAATPRNIRWIDLSEWHKKARERLQGTLSSFRDGKAAKSLNIIGPYGSGKSELMAWGFNYAWKDLSIPAIFVNLETLLDCLPEVLGPAKLVNAIDDFMKHQLNEIAENLENNTRPEKIHLAPDLRYDESFLGYFREMFGDSDLQPKRIQDIIQTGKAVLFLDEIEQKYVYLMERVPSDDRAPLRELFQAVDQGNIPYYLVGSFGLTSAYESVSDADTRREGTISLPIPDAAELGRLGRIEDCRNFIWWASRGRPGWALKLAQEWGENLYQVNRMENFNNLMPNTIENLPIVDANALSDVFVDAEQNRVITYLMKLISPTLLENILGDGQAGDDLLNRLSQHSFLVCQRQHLVRADDLCDAMLKDFQSISVLMKKTDIDWQLIRYYLAKVLRSMANEEDLLAFGGWRDKNEWAAKGGIVPLLVLLQDMMLEFEGDRLESAGAMSYLTGVFELCQVVGVQVTDSYAVVKNFFESVRLFREVMDAEKETYISLSPKAVESLFPRMVARPLLILHGDVKSSIKDQRAHVEATVSTSGWFLNTIKRIDSLDVTFILVPSQSTVKRLQENYFRRQKRDIYMMHDRVYVLLSLSEDTEELRLDFGANSDIRFISEIKKLQQHQIGERRLQDFLFSFWHNWLSKHRNEDDQNNIFEILDIMLKDPTISKSNRRKLEYYRNYLQQRLDDIALDASRNFRIELKKLFDHERDDFPHKRIEDTFVKVKDARSVEQVALAFDVRQAHEKSLEILYALRQQKMLKQLTKAPHGYGEFLDTYAAVKPKKGNIRPALNLEDIINFIKAHNDFSSLISIASGFGLDLGEDLLEASERTDRAPLLKLFGGITEVQKMFIRGLSLSSYLSENKEALFNQIVNQTLEADQLKDRLNTLHNEVNAFNESLGENILSDTELQKALQETETLHHILSNTKGIPPATLYILYRFSQSALRELETQRQRWSGDNGLEGWRDHFQEMLNWAEDLNELENQLETLYEMNPTLKNEQIGPKEKVTQEFKKEIEDAVGLILRKLDKPNLLSDPLPQIDLSEYNEALESTNDKLEEIKKEAGKADELISSLQNIKQRVENVISNLGA